MVNDLITLLIPSTCWKKVEKSINDHIESCENVIGIQPGIGPFRVLIADDQVYNRNMLVDVLEPIGFQTRQASNGQEALDVFENIFDQK